MKCNLKGSMLNGVMSNVLQNRGIKDIEKILNPSPPTFNLDNIKNIEKAINMFVKHINTSKILIPVDTDVDGFTSASLLYQAIKLMKPLADVTLYFHKNKEHGFSNDLMNFINENNFDFIIMTDAGSNDFEQIKELKSKGIDILILDHHVLEGETEYAVVINNQYENSFINTNFSGVGIVYIFLQSLINKYNINLDLRIFADLIATGFIADSMDISDEDVRYICSYGIRNIQNSLLKTYYKDGCNYKKIGWGIAPLINAIIREGNQEEKESLFLALSDNNNEQIHTVIKKKKNKETGKFDKIVTQQTHYEFILDMCTKIKSRQDEKVKKMVKKFLGEYDNKNNIAIFINDEEDKKIAGLVANKLAEKLQRPVLILAKTDNVLQGSARGNNKFCSSLKDLLNESNLVNWTSGHNQAFGVSVNEENIPLLIDYFNKIKAEEVAYDVDYIYEQKPPLNDIIEVAALEDEWSKGFEEPLFLIKNVPLNKGMLFYKNAILRFKVGDIVFIKKGVSKEEYELIKNSGFAPTINLDIVANFVSNDYNDKKNYQIEIIDFEIKTVNCFSGFF